MEEISYCTKHRNYAEPRWIARCEKCEQEREDLLNAKDAEIAQLKEDKASLEKSILDQSHALVDENTRLRDELERLDVIRMREDRLKEIIERQRKDNDELRVELEGPRIDYEKVLSEANAEIDRLSKELDKYKNPVINVPKEDE